MKTLERVNTIWQQVVVRGDGRQTEFQVRKALHAWWHRDRYLASAWSAMAAACLLRPAGPPRSVLMLGLAGGTVFRILRHLLPEAQLTAVEIDAEILTLARRHMQLDALDLEVHVHDARHWLRRNRRRFDVVIDDCYLAGMDDVYKPAAMDAEMLANLLRAVTPGGLVSVNLVTGAGHRRVQSAYRHWFREQFAVTRSLSVPEAQNEVLVGGDAVLPPSALAAWREKFPHPLDRRRWAGIQCQRLAR